jgi:hypothetical protein
MGNFSLGMKKKFPSNKQRPARQALGLTHHQCWNKPNPLPFDSFKNLKTLNPIEPEIKGAYITKFCLS